MVAASLAFSAALVAYGASPQFWLAGVSLVLVGLTYGYAFTSFAGIAQQSAPDHMRGRVLAVNSFVLGILFPVGTLVQGAIADVTSLRAITAGSGVVLAVTLLALHFVDRSRNRSRDRSRDRSRHPDVNPEVTVDGSQLLPHTTTTTRSPRSGT